MSHKLKISFMLFSAPPYVSQDDSQGKTVLELTVSLAVNAVIGLGAFVIATVAVVKLKKRNGNYYLLYSCFIYFHCFSNVASYNTSHTYIMMNHYKFWKIRKHIISIYRTCLQYNSLYICVWLKLSLRCLYQFHLDAYIMCFYSRKESCNKVIVHTTHTC